MNYSSHCVCWRPILRAGSSMQSCSKPVSLPWLWQLIKLSLADSIDCLSAGMCCHVLACYHRSAVTVEMILLFLCCCQFRDFGMTHAPSSRHPYASPAAAAAALPPPPHASKSAFASAAAQHSHHEPGYYAPAPAGPYSSGGAFGPGDAAGGGGMSKRPYSAGPGELDPKAFKKQRVSTLSS